MRTTLVLLAVLVTASSCAVRSSEDALQNAEDQIEQLLASQGTEINDLTTQCMIAQGYTDFIMRPPQVWQQPPLPDSDGQPMDRSSLEFAETHGFGIASDRLYVFEHDVPAEFFEPPEPEEVEDEEYLFALWSEVEIDGQVYGGGCYGWANQEWEQRHPEWSAVEPLTEVLGEYVADADRDSRIIAIEDALVACLRAQGFPDIQQKSDVTNSIHERIAALEPGLSEDRYEVELNSIRDYETELAISSWHCSEQVYDPASVNTYEQVQLEYKQSFVRDHPELLQPFE